MKASSALIVAPTTPKTSFPIPTSQNSTAIPSDTPAKSNTLILGLKMD